MELKQLSLFGEEEMIALSASYSLFQSYANQKANRINVPELNKIKAISSASQTLCARILVYINLTKETANGKV